MLKGKTALVTGAAGDLGKAMATALAREGAHVIVWDIKSENDASAAMTQIRAHDPKAAYQIVDVRHRASVDAAIAAMPALDIVCSNAGIVDSAPFLEVSQANWNDHIDINLTGCFNVCQAAARRMVADANPGRIILTSSWVARIPWPEISAYTVSKAGVNMLVKAMARELSPHGILVNAVAPGIVDAGLAGRQFREEPQYAERASKVIPLGEPGSPDDIAEAVVYLASPATAYMTGSVLTLDGGCSLFQFD